MAGIKKQSTKRANLLVYIGCQKLSISPAMATKIYQPGAMRTFLPAQLSAKDMQCSCMSAGAQYDCYATRILILFSPKSQRSEQVWVKGRLVYFQQNACRFKG